MTARLGESHLLRLRLAEVPLRGTKAGWVSARPSARRSRPMARRSRLRRDKVR